MESKFGGMEVSKAKQLILENENARLKRLLADVRLDHAAMKDLLKRNVMPQPSGKLSLISEAPSGVSERRACKAVGCCRTTMRTDDLRGRSRHSPAHERDGHQHHA